MKEKKIENLIEKYEAGASTLQDEQFLFDNADGQGAPVEAWSAFVKRNKRKAPANFNDSLWDSFQKKTNRKRKYKIEILSVAASVVLLLAIFIGKQGQEKLTYSEKEALLNQALGMFEDTDQTPNEQNIIYENDMIVIYTSSE